MLGLSGFNLEMKLLPLLLLLAAASTSVRAYQFQSPPALSPKAEDYDKYFNLGSVDGHQRDSFTRRIQRVFNNLAGSGAIRDGIRSAEDAVLEQPGGRPDPVQSALLKATLGADSAGAILYELLRLEALKVDKAWNNIRDAKASTAAIEVDLGKESRKLQKALQGGDLGDIPSQMGAIRGAIQKIEDSVRLMEEADKHVGLTRRGVTELLPRVDEAARWHADSHRAAGGRNGSNPTHAALRNLSGSVNDAAGLGEKVYAVMGQIQTNSHKALINAAEADEKVQKAAALVRAALASGDEGDKKTAAEAVSVASAAASKGAASGSGCAACAAKAAARAFGTKDEASGLRELGPFTPRVSLGESALGVAADGARKVRGSKSLNRSLKRRADAAFE